MKKRLENETVTNLVQLAVEHPEYHLLIRRLIRKKSERQRLEMQKILHSFYANKGKWSHEDAQREAERKKNAVVFGPYSDDHPTYY